MACRGVRLAGLYGLGDDTTLPAGSWIAVRRRRGQRFPATRVERKGRLDRGAFPRCDDPAAAEAVLASALADDRRATPALELIDGKKVLELVPAGRPLKDGAVERIVAEAELDAVLYAGDDLADLRAFEVLDRLAGRRALAP